MSAATVATTTKRASVGTAWCEYDDIQYERERERKRRLDDILDEHDRELVMPMVSRGLGESGSGGDSTDTGDYRRENVEAYYASRGGDMAEEGSTTAEATPDGTAMPKKKKRKNRGGRSANDRRADRKESAETPTVACEAVSCRPNGHAD